VGSKKNAHAPLKILYAAAEAHPFVKVGGLADVSTALLAALRKLDCDARMLLPAYPKVLGGFKDLVECARFPNPLGAGEIRLLMGTLPDSQVPVYAMDYPPYFEREGGPYQDALGHDWPDNAQRFALLARISALLASHGSPLDWRPDVLHCNDWHVGLAPAYLHYLDHSAATVMAIHNLAYQGIFPPALFASLALPAETLSIEGIEFYGDLSFLKAGIFYSDHIVTVSPRYAREIQAEPLGFGLQGLLSRKHTHLTGILNGIDVKLWNPATDPHIAKNFTFQSLQDKSANKRALQHSLGLEETPAKPLLSVISRILYQKGLDVLLDIAPKLLQQPVQIAVLGSGDADLEAAFKALARSHPGKVGVRIGFDEPLSHLITAGADIHLMPSRFEPCGLNQMYSQRYGTPPVVHATGGLHDTVVDATPANMARNLATGFQFKELDGTNFLRAIRRALILYADKDVWMKLQENGMRRDFGWDKSAVEYINVYRALLEPASSAAIKQPA
jgi:starch synthase